LSVRNDVNKGRTKKKTTDENKNDVAVYNKFTWFAMCARRGGCVGVNSKLI